MKKVFLIFVAAITITACSFAQETKDLFVNNGGPISWLGLDFSHSKLIGDFSEVLNSGPKDTWDIQTKYYPAWNKLIVNEQEKYDVGGMIQKRNVKFDIDMMMDKNLQETTEKVEAYYNPNYKKEDIEKFVKEYNLKSEEGIGILFFVEAINKASKEMVIHFVAINMSNKQILLTERIIGKPSGIGIRNYWGGAIYDVIKKIKSSYYKKWKANYTKK